jgi:tetratricopeptide (TPR) repeat protein
MKMKKSLLLLYLVVITSITQAQISKASLSPQVQIEQNVGLAKIGITYGQPGAKGRSIFGALIPYGKLWRTGANSSTKISLDQTVSFDGNIIPAGTYALYTIPQKDEWTIIIHKNERLWGDAGYDQLHDLVRFKVPVNNLKDYQETLLINFENFDANGADLVIKWENTEVKIPVFVDSDALVFSEIKEKVIDADGSVNAQTYFDAALFYYEKNKDLPLATTWLDKAIDLRPEAFWYKYYRAEMAFTLNDFTTAKKYAEEALAAAKSNTASDYGYIAKCELLLKEIAKKE